MVAIGEKLNEVPKPNDEHFRKLEEEENKKISELQTELQKIMADIASKHGGKEEFNNKRGEIRKKLNDINAEIQRHEQKMRSLNDQMSKQQEEHRAMRERATTMKKSLRFTSEAEMDEEISRLSLMQCTTTLSLKEEKEIIARISQLEKSRPNVQSCSKLNRQVDEVDASAMMPLRDQLKQTRETMSKLRESRNEEVKKERVLNEERSKAIGPVSDLFDKKTELNGQLKIHKQKLMDIKDVKMREHRLYNEYIQRLRRKRRDAEMAEKRKLDILRQKENLQRKLEQLEQDGAALPGMYLLQQTLVYTQKLVEQKRRAEEAEHDTVDTANGVVENPKSEVVSELGVMVKPKKDREEEFYCVPSKKKGKNRPRKQTKMGAISHDIRTLADFDSVNVPPPHNYDEAEECVNQLKSKLEALESQRSEHEAANEEKKLNLVKEIEAIEAEEKACEEATG